MRTRQPLSYASVWRSFLRRGVSHGSLVGMKYKLEECVDARNAAVPGILQVLECEAAVLRIGLLALERILSPHALRVDELGLPWYDVAVEVGNKLVLLVRHARAEVRDADVCLLAPAQVGLRDEHVAHGQHAKAAELFGAVEHDGREAARW